METENKIINNCKKKYYEIWDRSDRSDIKGVQETCG